MNKKLSRAKGFKTSRNYNCSTLKSAPVSHLLSIKIQSNVMLCFVTPALQDPSLSGSPVIL
jgi:hypothetical protein